MITLHNVTNNAVYLVFRWISDGGAQNTKRRTLSLAEGVRQVMFEMEIWRHLGHIALRLVVVHA